MPAVPTVHYVGAVLFCPFVGLLSAYILSVAVLIVSENKKGS